MLPIFTSVAHLPTDRFVIGIAVLGTSWIVCRVVHWMITFKLTKKALDSSNDKAAEILRAGAELNRSFRWRPQRKK